MNTYCFKWIEYFAGTDDTTFYVAISATVLGIATVIIVIIIVLYQRRLV